MWTDDKGVHFGIVRCFDKNAKKLAKKGILLVDDAIFNLRHMALELDIVDIELSTVPIDEYHRYVESEFQKALKLSRSLGKSLILGRVFHTQVADGYAGYVVTKVANKYACIEWRGFCPARWIDKVLGNGRCFDRVLIEDLARDFSI